MDSQTNLERNDELQRLLPPPPPPPTREDLALPPQPGLVDRMMRSPEARLGFRWWAVFLMTVAAVVAAMAAGLSPKEVVAVGGVMLMFLGLTMVENE